MTDDVSLLPQPPLEPAFFHQDSDTVRFWVRIGSGAMGASVSRHVLLNRYGPIKAGEDPLETHRAHLAELEAAVRQRVDKGSREPVMLREFDLRVQ